MRLGLVAPFVSVSRNEAVECATGSWMQTAGRAMAIGPICQQSLLALAWCLFSGPAKTRESATTLPLVRRIAANVV